MRKIITLTLLCLFLSGCGVNYESEIRHFWNKIGQGQKYTFAIRHRRTQEERYFKIERITEKEFNSLRMKDVK